MSIRIQARRGTEAEWIAEDPVLALGELAYSTDAERLKLGNGEDEWSSLTYVDKIPSQSGNSGKILITNGSNSFWSSSATFDGPVILNNNIDFTSASVIGLDLLPDQTSQSGKFLTTNGSETSWEEIPEPPPPVPVAMLLGGM